MLTAPKPANELERLQALSSYDILDTEREGAYDDIVRLVSQICGTPVHGPPYLATASSGFLSLNAVV